MIQVINKKISTSVALTIILVLAVIIGGFIYWQYSGTAKKEEVPGPELPEEQTDSKYCLVDEDCAVFGETGDCNCGCFNKDYPWWSTGECFCLAPTSCQCLNGRCEDVFEGLTGWKTYQNQDYKFEISFPGDWQINTIIDAIYRAHKLID